MSDAAARAPEAGALPKGGRLRRLRWPLMIGLPILLIAGASWSRRERKRPTTPMFRSRRPWWRRPSADALSKSTFARTSRYGGGKCSFVPMLAKLRRTFTPRRLRSKPPGSPWPRPARPIGARLQIWRPARIAWRTPPERPGAAAASAPPARGRRWRCRTVRTSWSLDSVADTLSWGRRFWILCIVDDFTREALALVVDTSIGAHRMARELDVLIARRGRPAAEPRGPPAAQLDQLHRPAATASAGDQLPTPWALTMIEGPAGGRSHDRKPGLHIHHVLGPACSM